MRAEAPLGLAGRLARRFLRSKLTPLLVLAWIALGVAAVLATPREEEPQIVVPMVDVVVPFPGATPREIESQLSTGGGLVLQGGSMQGDYADVERHRSSGASGASPASSTCTRRRRRGSRS